MERDEARDERDQLIAWFDGLTPLEMDDSIRTLVNRADAAEARALAAEAQRDKLRSALKPCLNVLQMLTDAKISPNTSMAAVWAQCVEAETRARSTLNEIAP